MGLVQFEDGKVLYYPYTPSKTTGLVFVALFAAATIAHIASIFRYRTRFFIPLVIGGICEIFGYYGRAWAGDLPNSPKPFMLQLLLILVSPVFVAGTLYVTLGRYKQSILGEAPRRCSPTSAFVLTDVIAFCTQIGGGLVQVTGNLNLMHIGDTVVLGGLAFQLVVLVIYIVLVVRLHKMANHEATIFAPWKSYVVVLEAAVVMIWVRNLVKTIEFAQGFYGFVAQHEAMLYIFDATLMLGVMVILIMWHPGRLIRHISRAEGYKLGNEMMLAESAGVPVAGRH